MKRILYGISVFVLLIPLMGYAGDEVEIDLDSLAEKPGQDASAATEEPTLPVIVPEELEKNPLWILAGLAILLPASMLLFPLGASKAPPKNHSQAIKVSSKKES